jgi:alcohol dehydrogenase class IV
MPHAETHTIILPHALAYNAPNIPEVMRSLAAALPGSDGDAIKGLNLLLEQLKVKRGLREFGFKEEDVDKAADIALVNAYRNPRVVERAPIRELLRRAWAGEPARADL